MNFAIEVKLLFLIAGSFVPNIPLFKASFNLKSWNEINESIHCQHFSVTPPPSLLTPSNHKEGKELDHTLPRLIMLHRASKLSLELARNCIIQPYLNGPPLPNQQHLSAGKIKQRSDCPTKSPSVWRPSIRADNC